MRNNGLLKASTQADSTKTMTASLNGDLFPEPGNANSSELPCRQRKSTLENFFSSFRKNIIGNQQTFISPFGKKQIVYADWTASGRAYKPIEEFIQNEIMPFLGNTHTETTITGTLMSKAYEEAKAIVKEHVHANSDDVLVFCGTGMTGSVNKLQRILGLRI